MFVVLTATSIIDALWRAAGVPIAKKKKKKML
jgi:hypothetical protein